MTWRRFLVLLRCLSPNSATVAYLSAERQMGKGAKVNVVRGAKAAQRAFEALFKPAPQRPKPVLHSRRR